MIVLNGSLSFHSGCRLASALVRSTTYTNWKGRGRSGQSVPSLSDTAILSSGATNDCAHGVVTWVTKRTMASFAAPSFPDASRCAVAGGANETSADAAMAATPWVARFESMVIAPSRAPVCPDGLAARARPEACSGPPA
jgi:hypothetical protein